MSQNMKQDSQLGLRRTGIWATVMGSMDQGDSAPPQRHARHRFSLRTAGVAVLLLLAGGAVGVAGAILMHHDAAIPATVSSDVTFTPHIPAKLPGSYRVDQSSFSLNGKKTVLAYRATDQAGAIISFTEQQRPNKLDFADIYRQRLSDVKTISGTANDAVAGMDEANGLLTISVLTDDTWVLITTKSPLNDTDIRLIARSVGH